MDNNLKIILDEFEKYKGQFVITDDWDVKRLIAIGSDDYDYYYICWDGVKTRWQTCVGRIVPLKGKIDDKHYDEFIRLAKLNHYDQLYLKKEAKNATQEKIYEIMTARIREKETELRGNNDEYLTEICWDVN